jgi:hypothetical protein
MALRIEDPETEKAVINRSWIRNTQMSKITIYRFKVYDHQNDEMITSRRWGTREAIERFAHGEVLENTGVGADANAVDSDIRGLTERIFDQHRRTDGY